MRIINLDATGIKIITSDKKQMYLTLAEVRDFLDKKYNLTENILSLNNKKLILSEKDMDEFPSVVTYIENNFKETPKEKESLIQLVASSMEYANMVVYEKSKEDKELEGMGTTLEVCLIYNNKAYIGHVGDSRIYRIRKDFIRKLTQDHSYV